VTASFGEEMRRLMARRGLSLHRLATLASYDVGYLSKVMNGRKPASRALAARLEEVLGAEGVLLAAASQAPGGKASAGPGRGGVSLPGSREPRLAGPFAPSVVGLVSRALYHRGPWRAEEPPDLAVLRRRVAAAWELRQSARYVALGEWLAGLLCDASAVAGALRAEQDTLEATAIVVHACNAASSLLKRLEAFELAAIAADRAYQAARTTGDKLLQASAALRLANVFLSGGRHGEAIEVAAGAAEPLMAGTDAGDAGTAVCGALLLTASVAAARLDQAAQAWELLGAAWAAGLRLGRDHAGLHAVFGPANVLIHGVQVATELGDAREALRRADRISIGAVPAPLAERRATLLIDIARSHARQADHAAATGALLDAERMAPEEIRFNAVAHRLAATLLHAARGRAPELRALATRMSVQD